jgi:hypothetical protein
VSRQAWGLILRDKYTIYPSADAVQKLAALTLLPFTMDLKSFTLCTKQATINMSLSENTQNTSFFFNLFNSNYEIFTNTASPFG